MLLLTANLEDRLSAFRKILVEQVIC